MDLIERGVRHNLLRKAEEKKEAARAAGDEEEYHELMSEMYGYEQESEGGQFMEIVFNSFFAASFAHFEYSLVRICQRALQDAQCPVTEELLGTRKLESIKKNFNRLKVDSTLFQGNEWREIQTYRRIRNALIHNGAILPKQESLLTYAKEKQIVSKWRERELVLTRCFCKEALENLKQFALRTHRAYGSWRKANLAGSKG